jgi:prophage regulatory protein
VATVNQRWTLARTVESSSPPKENIAPSTNGDRVILLPEPSIKLKSGSMLGDRVLIQAASRQPIEAASNPAALLRLDTVLALTGLGRSTLYARIKEGRFPEPIRQGTRCSRWRAASVTSWLESIT